jgi:Ni/Co efflux regulator RcnB
MRKTILTILAASLMAASTAQIAAAAEHRHARKIDRAPASEQFRNSNNAIASPAQPGLYSDYSDYSTSHMNMVGH